MVNDRTTVSRRRQRRVTPGYGLVALESRMLLSITFHVTFDDDGTYATYYSEIRSNLVAAGNEWASHLAHRMADITLQVSFADLGSGVLAESTSNGTAVVGHSGQYTINEYAPTDKIMNGVDPNGSGPDGEITLDTYSLVREDWFDPNPGAGSSGQVPGNKQDGYSILLHEMGHVLGFNGFRDSATGALFDNEESTFDKYVTASGGYYYFNGPAAKASNGGPVPLTLENMYHVGNDPGPGVTIENDLMSGLGAVAGTRYGVSNLDVAILKDTGLFAGTASPPVSPPPPTSPPTSPPPPTHVKHDFTPPTAYLSHTSITAASSGPRGFKVNYADNSAIKVSTLDSSDIRVTGPHNYSHLAHFVSIHKPGDGQARTATYTFADAHGRWTSADNGTYTITLRPHQVSDTAGNFMAGKVLGTIVVHIPRVAAKKLPSPVFSVAAIALPEPQDGSRVAWIDARKNEHWGG